MAEAKKKRPRAAATAGGRTRKADPSMSAPKRRGARVAAARHKAGLSQQGLADLIGTSRTTIARVEIGEQIPSVDLALAISGGLGTTVEQLFGGGR
jgi:putative transcriptional regulator